MQEHEENNQLKDLIKEIQAQAKTHNHPPGFESVLKAPLKVRSPLPWKRSLRANIIGVAEKVPVAKQLLNTHRQIKNLRQNIRDLLAENYWHGVNVKELRKELDQLNARPNSYESKLLDEFYYSFEERFRGPEEAVKKSMEVYKPIFDELSLNFAPADRSSLDLGSGRGEWLELQNHWGYEAHGIDLSPKMVDVCIQKGLKAQLCDALRYLEDLPDQSYAAITGFHIIEHLTHLQSYRLMKECQRVLKPGGVLLLETPNPENLTVSTLNFYTDPTHKNPLPPALLFFMFEHHKFYHIKGVYKGAPGHDGPGTPEGWFRLLKEPDYAVYGYKWKDV